MITQDTTPWHALDIAAVAAALRADPEQGLPQGEARERLAASGPNRMPEVHDAPLWRLVLRQFRSLVVLLLLAAAGVAIAMGEQLEATAILAALLANAAIGFGTEWRAGRSLAKLRTLATPEALVYRRGLARVPSAEVVPGDVIVLEAGSHIPADGRLIRSAALEVSEAALTGESMPVAKLPDEPVKADTPLADRVTMVYLGTTVVAGSGRALVTATGAATALGSIGLAVATAGERVTPLEKQIESLGRRVIGVALGICAVVAGLGILRGQPLGLMLETAISLAVSAIPEGLPAVTAMALAAGVWRLAHSNGLVRRLPAVETLGSTTVICADKTGTMTENRMTVVRFAVEGSIVDPRSAGPTPTIRRLLEVAALVNDAGIERGDDARLIGDPTETALLAAATDTGIDVERLRRQWPRRFEQPFDPATRLMATWNDMPSGQVALLVKGAPDAVLALCRDRETASTTVPLDQGEQERILETNRELAGHGLRVLAVAWRPAWEEKRIADLTFLGLVGMQDPVRPGVKEALAVCREAGLRTIMLTGDQRATAEAIGAELGLDPGGIRSRVSPHEKLALVERLQAEGEIVAMTGDGINDAPALARADIGIAMGRRGTDVARESADIVLTDDDFSTIVRAIAEGRTIYANLRKVIHFLFSCNLSEILTILIAIAAGFPSPLLPLQILWINIVTDILPAVALIRDPAEPDVMKRPARDPGEAMITWQFGRRMLVEGLLLALGVLSAYGVTVWLHGEGPRANTVAFLAVVLIHPAQAMNCRSVRVRWWRLPPNPWIWAALAALVFAQWWAIYWTPLARVLGTVPLAASDWIVSILALLWPIAVLEALKRSAPEPGSGSLPRPSEARRRQD
jgi:Ca2+-transporting ATPase